jgi:hypothetical protein
MVIDILCFVTMTVFKTLSQNFKTLSYSLKYNFWYFTVMVWIYILKGMQTDVLQ